MDLVRCKCVDGGNEVGLDGCNFIFVAVAVAVAAGRDFDGKYDEEVFILI